MKKAYIDFFRGKKTVFLRMLMASAKSFSRGEVKPLLGLRAKGRDVIEGVERYHLREEAASYMTLFTT